MAYTFGSARAGHRSDVSSPSFPLFRSRWLTPVAGAVLVVLAIVFLALLFVAFSATTALAAVGDWTGYHHDAARTGAASDQDALGGVQLAWTSAELDGKLIYAQPLVVGDRVLVATEGNSLFALNAGTGAVVWNTPLGAPVPRSSLPGGNIDPSGITGTPLVDVSTNTIFVVAFLRSPRPHHELFALDLTTGAVLWHRTVDPPGLSPLVEQQRGALALSGGRIYVPYGGLAGDIGQYKGAVVSAAADGSGALASYIVPTSRMAGIWNPTGLVVDGNGDLWVVTGNSASRSTFDYGNSVIRLSAGLSVLDYFAPTNWASLNASDLDLSSLGPVLLPGGRVLAVAKSGTAYLLSAAKLGHVGAALATASIGSAPFGTAAVLGSRVFVPCSGALKALDVSANRVQVAWTLSGGTGSPIVAAGYVWTLAYDGKLKAVDPTNGSVVLTLQFGKPASRFITLAAANGRLFVPDGRKINALNLHGSPTITGLSPNVGSPAGNQTVTITGNGFIGATAVSFGGTPAAAYAVNSPTRITATTPAHAFGQVDVVVTTSWGSSDPTGTANDYTFTNRYEQTDSHLAFSGAWTTGSNPGASGSSWWCINASGAAVTANFTGTAFTWVTVKSPNYGIAQVTLDGGTPVTVDLYSPTALWQQKVWSTTGLADSAHTVKIAWTGAKNATATAAYIGVDAFDVEGTLKQAYAATLYQQTDSRVFFSGSWITASNPGASGGSWKCINASGGSVTVPFNGTAFSWVTVKSPNYGIAQVTLDGGTPVTVDLYSSSTSWQQQVWSVTDLAAGLHSVNIAWTGDKNPAAAPGATYIGVDAFEVVGTMASATRVEETDSRLLFGGAWTSAASSLYSGGSFKYANTAGASVTIAFTGVKLDLIGTIAYSYGKAQVTLDGGAPVSVDLYNPTALYKQTMFSTGLLSLGDHTVTLEWAGAKNSASSNTYVSLDAVDVVGNLR